ncbi:MAG: recombinase family protein [Oscillospiraceae bacterium]|nr:recombinase family protein [Oscillospiraceae bacterium]
MEQQVIYNAAIYCRLSRDDLSTGESSSIQTQKALLTKYVTENGWRVAGCYVDDGYSGTNYNRPDFERMIEDIEDGKINLVITKDLSRLGRDYIKTGYYSEIWFPENGVRYIALNDGIDSLKSDNDIAPFKNILNEMYAKDLSKKIKSAFRVKFARGDYHGAFPHFGYAKDPNNNCKLIIDAESAETVRLIFDLAKQGYGAARIRTVLIDRKLPTPAAYLYKRNPEKWYTKKFQNAAPYEFYAWSTGMVDRIRDDEIYIGNTIHYREISVSYKTKNRYWQPRDKWWRVENTHEPIIDIDTWNLVQRRYHQKARPARKNPPNIFQRIVLCADCQKLMWLTPRQYSPKGELTERRYFHCGTYRQHSKLKCSMHNASYAAVQAIVLNDIREYARLAMESPEELLARLTETENRQKQAAHEQAQKDYTNGVKRLGELENLLRRLFEENVAGRMSNENYEAMFSLYQAEQQSLKPQLEMLSVQLAAYGEDQNNGQKWIALIAKYADLQELDAPIVNELCEKILIHQHEKVNRKRVQKIEIFYRFVGKLPTVNGEVEHEIHGSRHLCANNAIAVNK